VKLTVERLPESRVVLDIAADEAEFAKAMDRAARKVGNQVTIPGFRRGKAPRGMIERTYGRQVFLEEAHRLLMDDLYRQALKEAEVNPVGDPEVEVTEIEPLAFKVTLPVYPEIDPGDYATVRVEPVDAAVGEEEVDAEVETLRKANSPWVDPAEEGMELGPDRVLRPKVRTPRDGDQVTIDYAVFEGDEADAEKEEDAEFVLGESGLLDRLEQEIKGLRVGESTAFDVAFAEDDSVVDPGLRGKTMHYTVTLKGLKERDLVPLDDDFARAATDVESLTELRDRVRQNLHRDKTASARAEVLSTIISNMADAATIEPPAAMVDEALTDDIAGMRQRLSQRGLSMEAYLRLTGQSEDDLREELRPEAARKLRQSLLLREIARREGIAVDEADIDASVERMAASATTARDPGQAAAFFRSDYVRDSLRGELFDRKLQDRLIELATEGRGAVLNAWTPPIPDATAPAVGESEGDNAVPGEDASAPDRGRLNAPGELAEAAESGDALSTGEPVDTAVREAANAAQAVSPGEATTEGGTLTADEAAGTTASGS
jgi:trigger factor